MKRVLVIIIKVVLILCITIIGIATLLVGTLYILNENHKINEPAKRFLNHYIVADMDFENLYLDLEEFPTITITADNGLLISHLYKYPTDTLATFDNLEVVMEVNKLWDSDSLTISIPYVKVTNGFTLVTISENRVPGWNVWRFRAPKPRAKVQQIPPQRLWINEVQLCGHNRYRYYNDYRKRIMNITADSVYVHGSVQIRANNIYFDTISVQNGVVDISLMNGETIIKGTTPRLTLSSTIEDSLRYYTLHTQVSDAEFQYMNSTIFNNGDSVGIDAVIGINPTTGRYSSQGTHFTLNKTTELDITGKYDSRSDMAAIDLTIATPSVMDMAREFALDTLPIFEQVTPIDLALRSRIKMDGYLNVNDITTIPPLDAAIESWGGSLWINHIGTLRDLKANLAAKVNLNNNSTDSLQINQLDFKYKHSSLMADGLIYMLGADSPVADIDLIANIDIADIEEYIPSELELCGETYINASVQYPLHKGADKSLTKIYFNDCVRIRDFTIMIPHTQAQLLCESGVISLENSQRLNYPDLIQLSLDSISLDSYEDMNIGVAAIHAGLMITPSEVQYLPNRLTGGVTFKGSRCDFSTLDTLAIGEIATTFMIDLEEMQAPLVDYTAGIHNVRFTSNDSMLLRLDSLDIDAYASLFKMVDFSHDVKYKLWDVIGDWKYGGALHIDSLRGIMPQLPLITTIHSGELEFNQDDFTLEELNVTLGDSYGNLSGEVQNWRNYITDDSLLTVNATLNTKHVMLNELIPAIVDGGIYAQNLRKGERNTHTGFLDVPQNLDVELKTSILNTNYEHIKADSACFTVKIKDKGFYVDSLRLMTDFLTLGVDFSYLTADRDSADTALHFDIERFNAAGLIHEVPTISHAIPLLSSFKGDFKTTFDATWIIDKNMDIVTPSIHSTANLKGESLSLARSAVMPNWLGWLLLGRDKDIRIDTLDIDLAIDHELLLLYPTTVNVNDKYLIDANGVTSVNAYRYHLLLKENPLWFKIALSLFNQGERFRLKLASIQSQSLKEMASMLESPDTTQVIYDPTNAHQFNIKSERHHLNNSYRENYDKLNK